MELAGASALYSSVTWCIILPAVCTLVYWYFTRTFSHWEKKKVHHLKPLFLFGSIKDRILFRISFHMFQLSVYRQFKGHKIAGFYEGRRPTLMILDPDIIRHIMVRDFDHFVDRPTFNFRDSPYVKNMVINLKGTEWKDVRHLMTPAFSSGKLKAMQSLICTVGEQMADYLKKNIATKGGQSTGEIEMKEFFGRFTMDVIATTAFGVQSDSFKDQEAEFVKMIAKFSDITLPNRILIFMVILLTPWLAKFLPLSFFNMTSINFLGEVVKAAKKQRQDNTDKRRNDFLQLMLDAEANEEPSQEDGDCKKQTKDEEKSSKKSILTEDVIVAQSILFLLAGFETSSTLLTFASYELALNLDQQKKLRKEILEVLEKHGGECSYQALSDMTYLENVLSEALRKHPPIARVDRTCTKQYTIPGTDVVINPGESVSVPIMGLHYDSDYFPEPEKFDPERFSQESKISRHSYVYLPFGSGPRNCIGLRFAIMSTKVAMVYILKDFEIQTCDKTEVPYEFSKFSMLLKPKNGIWLSFSKI